MAFMSPFVAPAPTDEVEELEMQEQVVSADLDRSTALDRLMTRFAKPEPAAPEAAEITALLDESDPWANVPSTVPVEPVEPGIDFAISGQTTVEEQIAEAVTEVTKAVYSRTMSQEALDDAVAMAHAPAPTIPTQPTAAAPNGQPFVAPSTVGGSAAQLGASLNADLAQVGDTAIGFVAWSTISKADVTRDALVAAFDHAGLEHNLLPAEITALSAYKRATRSSLKEYQFQGNTARLRVVEVATEPELVTRHIVREEVDANGKRVNFTKIGEANFSRPGDKAGTSDGVLAISWDGVTAEEQSFVQEAHNDMQNRYSHALTHYDSNAVRSVLTDLLASMKSIGIRPSGGVYFVAKDHLTRLAQVKALIRELPGANVFHTIPLIDNAEQRTMLSQAFTEEVESEVTGLLAEIADVNQKFGTEPIPTRTVNALTKRLSEALERAEEHDRTLQLVSDRSRAALDAAVAAVTDVASRKVESKRGKAA